MIRLVRRAGRFMSSAFNFVAALCLLSLAFLTVADVGSRNLRNTSILGTVEISTVLMVGIAFLGLAAAERNGNHVSVSLLEERVPTFARLAFSAIRLLLLVGLGLLLTWGLTSVLQSALERDETTNGILRLPTTPWHLVVLVSFAFFFLFAAWQEVKHFTSFRAEARAEGKANRMAKEVEG